MFDITVIMDKKWQQAPGLAFDTRPGYGDIYCIHHLFENQVRKTPGATAVRAGDQTFSYRQLNRLSNQLAHHLGNYVISPNTVIAFCLFPGIEMVIAILGILKAGGACLALDITASKQYKTQCLRRSCAAITLSQKALASWMPDDLCKTLYLDTDTHWQGDQLADINPICPTQPSHLACVIDNGTAVNTTDYVFISHKTLAGVTHNNLKKLHKCPHTSTLQYNKENCDIFYQEFFSTLCSGSSLVLMSKKLKSKKSLFWRFIAKEKINRVFLPRNCFENLAESYEHCSLTSAFNKTNPNALREIVISDEQCPDTPAIRHLLHNIQHCRIIQNENI